MNIQIIIDIQELWTELNIPGIIIDKLYYHFFKNIILSQQE